jgi:glucosamine--fructose-6-phosphate aminotransferase (isomerizing)
MCGIVGYIGFRQGDQVVISSLKRLEYRGYDSWGYAVANGKEIEIKKKVGSISAVEVKEKRAEGVTVSIGHTRWATHGKPSDINAHPHTDCDEEIAVVHNGIITNFSSLKNELISEGHIFRSETDTEVIPHLIERCYKDSKSFEEAVIKAIKFLKGSYAFVALKKDEKKLIACKYKSPLILGVGDGELIFASDVPAILEYTNRVIYLNDGDIVIAEPGKYRIINERGEVVRDIELIHWSIEDAEKSGYEHFMLKEINENPRVIEDTLGEYVTDKIELDPSFAAGISEIVIVACGTSYHAGLIGKYVIEKLAGIPVRVEYASEYNYHQIIPGRSLILGITQSGETADTLEALRAAKRMGLRTCSIVNVVGSTATKISDHVLFTRAGPEISVAATKSFIAQLIVLYIIAIKLSPLTRQEKKELIEELKSLPEKVQRILDKQHDIDEIAKKLSNFENIMYIGRGLGFPTALEGALKMKEISYIHAEGYPAGELKHGPFALLGENTPVVAVINRDETYEIMLNNIKEVKARESLVIAVSDDKDEEVDNFVDFAIKTPETLPILSPILHSVAFQLLAYFTARIRGCEIDKPRNLAKSVTVE